MREVAPIRRRPSSRLLVLDPGDQLLLFRFVFRHGVLAGQDYWATPGGAVEAGETFAHAARRELFEETGIVLDAVDEAVAERSFVLQLADGELVMADERYFLVRTASQMVLSDHRTAWEHEVMAEHRWWSIAELAATSAVIFPEHVVDLLASVASIGSLARRAATRTMPTDVSIRSATVWAVARRTLTLRGYLVQHLGSI